MQTLDKLTNPTSEMPGLEDESEPTESSLATSSAPEVLAVLPPEEQEKNWFFLSQATPGLAFSRDEEGFYLPATINGKKERIPVGEECWLSPAIWEVANNVKNSLCPPKRPGRPADWDREGRAHLRNIAAGLGR